MLTCKDCIGYDFCPDYEKYSEIEIKEVLCEGDVRNLCSDFKNKADYVKVVRCKDCGSYNKHYSECTLNGSHFGENGYCCRGTRTPKERGGEK